MVVESRLWFTLSIQFKVSKSLFLYFTRGSWWTNKRWIHPDREFIGSLNASWSESSWIEDPGADLPSKFLTNWAIFKWLLLNIFISSKLNSSNFLYITNQVKGLTCKANQVITCYFRTNFSVPHYYLVALRLSQKRRFTSNVRQSFMHVKNQNISKTELSLEHLLLADKQYSQWNQAYEK